MGIQKFDYLHGMRNIFYSTEASLAVRSNDLITEGICGRKVVRDGFSMGFWIILIGVKRDVNWEWRVVLCGLRNRFPCCN